MRMSYFASFDVKGKPIVTMPANARSHLVTT